MRTYLVAFTLVLGVGGQGPPGSIVPIEQTGPVLSTACPQDFPSAASPDARASIVMCGLDNPRGLAFGPEGALYVAEAGSGGQGPCVVMPNATLCYGPTGGVSRLWHGAFERVVTGLPSFARSTDGQRAIGPQDVAMLGPGTAHVTIGLENDPAFRETKPEFSGFGRLVRFKPDGTWQFTADIAAFETAHNPDDRSDLERCAPGDPGPCPYLDSNPFGLLALHGGHLVTDAGANTLFRLAANGDLSLVAIFHSRGTDTEPPRTTDAVPTTVVEGPDGAYYVGELTGVPFAAGTANIYRVVPGDAQQTFLTTEACVSGFKMIIDMTFDVEGTLYVLQHSTGPTMGVLPGVLIRVAPDRTQSDICAQYQRGTRTTLVTGLTRPTGLVAGEDGALYISNRGTSAGVGQVIRFKP
jgi:hypothetical protein